ncbi:hypothetical protein AAHH87_00180 [Candidatus Hodgkinia cicadicola]
MNIARPVRTNWSSKLKLVANTVLKLNRFKHKKQGASANQVVNCLSKRASASLQASTQRFQT